MPGIDKSDVEAAPVVSDLLEAFADVETGAAIVDWEAIVEIVWATIHQPDTSLELRLIDLCVAPPGRERA